MTEIDNWHCPRCGLPFDTGAHGPGFCIDRCPACRHASHAPGECRAEVNVGTGYFGRISGSCPCVAGATADDENEPTAPEPEPDTQETRVARGLTFSEAVRNREAEREGRTLAVPHDEIKLSYWDCDPFNIGVGAPRDEPVLEVDAPPEAIGRTLVALELHFMEGDPVKIEFATKIDPTEDCEGMGV